MSLRSAEDLQHERRMTVSHETIGSWQYRLGPMFAAEVQETRIGGMCLTRWRRRLSKLLLRISDVSHDLWRAVGHG